MIKKILKGKYKGLWLVRIQPMVNGKRKSVTRRADSKLEAQKLEIDLKVKYASYKNGLPSITDESQLLIEYTKFVEKKAQSITATTNRSWRYSLTLLGKYLKYENKVVFSCEMLTSISLTILGIGILIIILKQVLKRAL